MTVITIIGLVLTRLIGIWKFFTRVKSERRKLADEAGKKLIDAHNSGNKSDLLDAWMRKRRL